MFCIPYIRSFVTSFVCNNGLLVVGCKLKSCFVWCLCPAEHMGTKTAVQIRSHAQKFFSKLTKGTAAESEYLVLARQLSKHRVMPVWRLLGLQFNCYHQHHPCILAVATSSVCDLHNTVGWSHTMFM